MRRRRLPRRSNSRQPLRQDWDKGVITTVKTATLVVPYYRQPLMLARQVREWNSYPEGWKIILVDDGSPEPALPVVQRGAYDALLKDKLRLYRIGVDIPWNRGGARNLGAHVCETDWLVHVDIDHLLPKEAATKLLKATVQTGCWYRFPRWRVGRADDTRRKDKISPDCEFGKIHEHVDSYLITKKLYWSTGGYNEVFSGCLGGGGAFLHRLEKRFAGPPSLLPDGIPLHVYTRTVVQDSSDWALSRDPAEYAARKRIHGEMSDPIRPLNFPWERVL